MAERPSPVVVDTSVTSLLFSRRGAFEYYSEQIIGRQLLISFQTFEEHLFGVAWGNWGKTRSDRLRRYLDQQFEVVWPTPEMVEISANLRSERQKAGCRLSRADAWIAATALFLKCPLACDDDDFEGIPHLQIIRAPRP